MTERLGREIAHLLDEAAHSSDGMAPRDLLRARLAATISARLQQSSSSNGRGSEDDIASVAAFLDGSLTPAEQDAMITKLASDASARADVAAAAALLDAIQAQPKALPAELAARAASLLASPTSPALQHSDWKRPWREAWGWGTPMRFGLAAAMLLVVTIPVAVTTLWNEQNVLPGQHGKGPPVGRGLQLSPPEKGQEGTDPAKGGAIDKPEAKPCNGSTERAQPQPGSPQSPTAHSTNTEEGNSTTAGDPCSSRPATEDDRAVK